MSFGNFHPHFYAFSSVLPHFAWIIMHPCCSTQFDVGRRLAWQPSTLEVGILHLLYSLLAFPESSIGIITLRFAPYQPNAFLTTVLEKTFFECPCSQVFVLFLRSCACVALCEMFAHVFHTFLPGSGISSIRLSVDGGFDVLQLLLAISIHHILSMDS